MVVFLLHLGQVLHLLFLLPEHAERTINIIVNRTILEQFFIHHKNTIYNQLF